MKLNLDAILAEAEKASPAPWTSEAHTYSLSETGDYESVVYIRDAKQALVAHVTESDSMEEDGDFIAHARTNVPLLVQRVRDLEKALSMIASTAKPEHPASLHNPEWCAGYENAIAHHRYIARKALGGET